METRAAKETIEKTHQKTRGILGRLRMIHDTLKEIKGLLDDLIVFKEEEVRRTRIRDDRR